MSIFSPIAVTSTDDTRAAYFFSFGGTSPLHTPSRNSVGTVPRAKVSVVEIFCECFGRPKNYMTRKDTDEIISIMARIPGWERPAGATQRSKAYGKQRVFIRIG